MGPKSVGMGPVIVLPSVFVQSFDGRIVSPAVYGYQDRENENGRGNEDFEEHPEVSEEEIGVEATF